MIRMRSSRVRVLRAPSWCRPRSRPTTGRDAAGCAILRVFCGDLAPIVRNSECRLPLTPAVGGRTVRPTERSTPHAFKHEILALDRARSSRRPGLLRRLAQLRRPARVRRWRRLDRWRLVRTGRSSRRTTRAPRLWHSTSVRRQLAVHPAPRASTRSMKSSPPCSARARARSRSPTSRCIRGRDRPMSRPCADRARARPRRSFASTGPARSISCRCRR